MDSAASVRRFFDQINAGDLDGFIDLLGEDFIEHEQMRGLPPGRRGPASCSR
ncbi:MAG: nuclear transport factor 2 family protein [Solirubrobacterales bacterium]|nr:nuclear transport factor 2 family protein [Solirubrobacterales bacterium]